MANRGAEQATIEQGALQAAVQATVERGAAQATVESGAFQAQCNAVGIQRGNTRWEIFYMVSKYCLLRR